jgi:hypothetical protein
MEVLAIASSTTPVYSRGWWGVCTRVSKSIHFRTRAILVNIQSMSASLVNFQSICLASLPSTARSTWGFGSRPG